MLLRDKSTLVNEGSTSCDGAECTTYFTAANILGTTQSFVGCHSHLRVNDSISGRSPVIISRREVVVIVKRDVVSHSQISSRDHLLRQLGMFHT